MCLQPVRDSPTHPIHNPGGYAGHVDRDSGDHQGVPTHRTKDGVAAEMSLMSFWMESAGQPLWQWHLNSAMDFMEEVLFLFCRLCFLVFLDKGTSSSMFQLRAAKHFLQSGRRPCGWGRVTEVGPLRSGLARKAILRLETFPQGLLCYGKPH